MLVSTYVLFSKASDIIEVFSSSAGREYLQEALDDIKIIKEYADEYLKLNSKSISYIINTKEVMDIAYSYHCFKKTGECKRCTYSDDVEDFKYNWKEKPFNQQTIFEALKDLDNADFMVEPEFNVFVKDWLSNSDTIKQINKLFALGYNEKGEFGFYSPVIDTKKGIKSVKDKTIRLLLALLKHATSCDLNANDNITYLDNALMSLKQNLSIPTNTSFVFGTSYNKLNDNVTKFSYSKVPTDSKQIDVTEQRYKQLQDRYIDYLVLYDARYNEYLNKINSDCNVIFKARSTNISNRAISETAYDFLLDNKDWLIKECNAKTDLNGDIDNTSDLAQFIDKLYKGYTSKDSLKHAYNSLLSFIKLYSMLSFLSVDMLNNVLNLDFNREDYLAASEELYTVFTIPFMPFSVSFDILYDMQNSNNITSEVNTIKPPTDSLVKFAFITARTVDSISWRKQMNSRKRGI